jgi:hypothetical protein
MSPHHLEKPMTEQEIAHQIEITEELDPDPEPQPAPEPVPAPEDDDGEADPE